MSPKERAEHTMNIQEIPIGHIVTDDDGIQRCVWQRTVTFEPEDTLDWILGPIESVMPGLMAWIRGD